MSSAKMIPFLAAMSVPEESRNDVLQIALPNIVSMSDRNRLALSAFSAQSVSQQHQRELSTVAASVVREMGIAAKMLQGKDTKLSDEDLKQLPTIRRLNLRTLVESHFDATPQRQPLGAPKKVPGQASWSGELTNLLKALTGLAKEGTNAVRQNAGKPPGGSDSDGQDVPGSP